MNNKLTVKNYTKYLFTLIIILVAVPCSAVGSSQVYFTVPAPTIAPHINFSVDVFLDSTDPINALDLEVSYPKDQLQFVGTDNTKSIVGIWQGSPKLLSNGNIHLIGGLLKPFQGQNGLIVKILFKTLSTGPVQFSFAKNNIYIADGKGTVSSTTYTTSSLLVDKNAPPLPTSTIGENNSKPDIFLERTNSPIDGSSLISFHASDNESGIRVTQIRMKSWFIYSSWQDVENSVTKSNGVWAVEVKAINNSGVETIKSIYFKDELFKKIITTAFLISVLLFIIFWVYNNRKRKL